MANTRSERGMPAEQRNRGMMDDRERSVGDAENVRDIGDRDDEFEDTEDIEDTEDVETEEEGEEDEDEGRF